MRIHHSAALQQWRCRRAFTGQNAAAGITLTTNTVNLFLPADQQRMCRTAAGEMLHAAEPFLERHLHPTVIIRGFVKALEDALAVVDELAFPIDIHDREQMLKIIASCIGTKFTSRFGTLMPVCNIFLTSGMWQKPVK